MAFQTAKRKIAHPGLRPLQRHFGFQAEGLHFDLREIFDALNARHFRGALRGYRITWGRRRRQAPKAWFVFGTIHEGDRVIRIHPRLDQPWVPRWFLEYVIYHEMLHAVVPDVELPSGRRRVHTAEFQRREREFPHYSRARRWEVDNLARFLR